MKVQVEPEGLRPAMMPRAYRVLERRVETHDTWTLSLAPEDGAEPPGFEAGQFNMLYAFGRGEAPISICGDPSVVGRLDHTIRAVGGVTRWLCALEPGGILGVRGPYGQPWPIRQLEDRDLLLVAGGIGLAPLRPALLAALAAPERFRSVRLLYGAREPGDQLYRAEYERWRARGLDVRLIVDNAGQSVDTSVGVVTDLIARVSALNADRTTALLCGPEAMMRYCAEALEERGVAADQIFVSLERNMRCAVGHCGRCQLGPHLLCRDGPVFRYDRVSRQLGISEL